MDPRLAHAETLLELGRAVEAEAVLRDVLASDPESVEALQELARALHHQDRDREAEWVARQAVALSPQDHRGYLVLTDVLCERDDVEAALDSARQCLRIAPHAWTSHYAMARALLAGRRPQTSDAYRAALRAVELQPHHPTTHNLVGLCLEGLNDPEAAERAYRNALQIDPLHTNAQNNLARLHLERGRLGHGAAMLRHAVGHAPQEKVLHANLDVVLLLLGRRIMWSMFAAAAVLGVLLVTEAPWWSRVLTGAGYLGVLALLLRRFRDHLPRGVSRWGRGLFARAHWQGKYLLGLLALLSVGVLLLAFAPYPVAAASGVLLLGVLRVLGIACIVGWIAMAAINLVRGR